MGATDFASVIAMMKHRSGHWAQQSLRVIREVHASLGDDTSLQDRKRAIDEAYPFGLREQHPYKEWLKVRRDYLGLFGYVSTGRPKVGKLRDEAPNLFAESPLERAQCRAPRRGRS